MPDKDVKFGTAASKPEGAGSNAPDMSRYYYPPGTTEPQLRPEFANESAAPEPASANVGEEAKRGSLPDDFPHVELLRSAGITTYAKAKNLNGDYGSVEGIGEMRGAEIDAAL